MENDGGQGVRSLLVRRGLTLLGEPVDLTRGGSLRFDFVARYDQPGERTEEVSASGTAADGSAVIRRASARVQVVAPPKAGPRLLPVPGGPPIELVPVAAGEFLMGSDPKKDRQAFDDEQPQHTLYLDEFAIGKYPVTVAQFDAFITAAGHKSMAEKEGYGWAWSGSQWEKVQGADWRHPRGPKSDVSSKADHPVTQVSWSDAVAFCEWLGVQLPSEAQWEKAARGSDGRLYPWGNPAPDKTRCNFNMNVDDTTPVGMYPGGASPCGALDMSGNVWEWTRSLWGKDPGKSQYGYPYRADDGRENLNAPDDVLRVVRGGSFFDDARFVRCAVRLSLRPWNVDLGFRVCVSPGL